MGILSGYEGWLLSYWQNPWAIRYPESWQGMPSETPCTQRLFYHFHPPEMVWNARSEAWVVCETSWSPLPEKRLQVISLTIDISLLMPFSNYSLPENSLPHQQTLLVPRLLMYFGCLILFLALLRYPLSKYSSANIHKNGGSVVHDQCV